MYNLEHDLHPTQALDCELEHDLDKAFELEHDLVICFESKNCYMT